MRVFLECDSLVYSNRMPFQPVVLLTIVFTLFCGGWLIVRWPAIPTTGRVTFSLALVLCVGYLIAHSLPI